jgi:small subunit ribosomal protein S18
MDMNEDLKNEERMSSSDEDMGDRKKFQRGRFKKRVLDTRNLVIDYKTPEVLEKFISKTGKILPRRMTGATARVQRKISREIKRSRMIRILPFSKR